MLYSVVFSLPLSSRSCLCMSPLGVRTKLYWAWIAFACFVVVFPSNLVVSLSYVQALIMVALDLRPPCWWFPREHYLLRSRHIPCCQILRHILSVLNRSCAAKAPGLRKKLEGSDTPVCTESLDRVDDADSSPLSVKEVNMWHSTHFIHWFLSKLSGSLVGAFRLCCHCEGACRTERDRRELEVRSNHLPCDNAVQNVPQIRPQQQREREF